MVVAFGLMSEFLAIKTDKAREWDKGKDRVAVDDLSPRGKDEGRKSSWAHYERECAICSSILANPAKATQQLQALALFIFSQRTASAPIRNKISGVSIARSAIRPELIVEDFEAHPIEAYCSTHRSLLLADVGDRESTASEVLSGRHFESWKYTRDILAEVLQAALDTGSISLAFERDAKSLLLEWRS